MAAACAHFPFNPHAPGGPGPAVDKQQPWSAFSEPHTGPSTSHVVTQLTSPQGGETGQRGCTSLSSPSQGVRSLKKLQQYLDFVISVLKVTAYHHHSQHAVVLCTVQVLVPSPALWATLGKKLTLSNPLFLACKMGIEIGGMGRHPVAWPLPAQHSVLLPLLPMG